MTGRLSASDRRALGGGAAAIVLLLLLARGIPAWRSWDAGARASAAEMEAEAALAAATVERFPAALDSLEARRGRLVMLGAGVLDGGSPASSGAELAALVSGAAVRAGVQLGAVQPRADTAAAGTFVRVGVRADGTGDLPGILRLLALLEGAPERVAVRAVSLTQPAPGGPAEQAEALRLELTVEALALAPGATVPRDTLSPPALPAADPFAEEAP